MKKQSVTLVQVAKKAGVSVMTASRAMSGDGYVSEETKTKVQAAAKLGYAPNTLARVMKGGRTNVIGVVVNDLSSVVVNAFVSALTEEVRKYEMDLSSTTPSASWMSKPSAATANCCMACGMA
jgi:LacI family transcriptional regulator